MVVIAGGWFTVVGGGGEAQGLFKESQAASDIAVVSLSPTSRDFSSRESGLHKERDGCIRCGSCVCTRSKTWPEMEALTSRTNNRSKHT